MKGANRKAKAVLGKRKKYLLWNASPRKITENGF